MLFAHSLSLRAAGILRPGVTGRVLASFRSVCDLVTDAGEVVALAWGEVGNGPLNVVLERGPEVAAPAGARFAVMGQVLRVGEVVVDLSRAARWDARPDWERLRARRGAIVAAARAARRSIAGLRERRLLKQAGPAGAAATTAFQQAWRARLRAQRGAVVAATRAARRSIAGLRERRLLKQAGPTGAAATTAFQQAWRARLRAQRGEMVAAARAARRAQRGAVVAAARAARRARRGAMVAATRAARRSIAGLRERRLLKQAGPAGAAAATAFRQAWRERLRARRGAMVAAARAARRSIAGLREQRLLKQAGPTGAAAATAFQQAWRRDDRAGIQSAIRNLCGLGPGLTPAGDDWLAGWLLGQHLAPDLTGLRDLSGLILEIAAGRTTTIARALLECAAAGEADEAWHELLDALAGEDANRQINESTNQRADAATARILAHGATSGAAMLAGFFSAVEILASIEN